MTQPLQHQPRQTQQAHQHHPKPTAAHVAAPAATPSRKLGRKPRAFNPKIPHYSAARLRQGVKAPAPLAPVHWTKGMPDNLGFMLNDHLGDCPIAGGHHGRQVWSFNGSGAEITDTDAAVLADYEAFCGYVDGDDSTDQGGRLQDVLSQAVKVGFTTAAGPDKLAGFYEVDPRNLHDCGVGIAESGFLYIGIDIPQLWSGSNAGDTWDATDSPVEGGHCVILTGFELGADGLPSMFDVVSWGMQFRMTRAGFQQACDEAYVLIDRCWVEKTGKTPAGLTLEQVEADMQAVKAV